MKTGREGGRVVAPPFHSFFEKGDKLATKSRLLLFPTHFNFFDFSSKVFVSSQHQLTKKNLELVPLVKILYYVGELITIVLKNHQLLGGSTGPG